VECGDACRYESSHPSCEDRIEVVVNLIRNIHRPHRLVTDRQGGGSRIADPRGVLPINKGLRDALGLVVYPSTFSWCNRVDGLIALGVGETYLRT
jgi:hypothetical protein